MDTPENEDVIVLHFLQHFTPNYTEDVYSHWVENLYAHKAKNCDTTQVKRKRGRPPKQKIEQNENQKPAENTHTTQSRQANKNSKNENYLINCKVQPRYASLGYSFHNTATHM